MKLPCEMIQDLLPLYHDGVCSEVSKTVVREHLAGCDACAQLLRNMDADIDIPKLDADEAKPLREIQTRLEIQKKKVKCIAFAMAILCLLTLAWIALLEWPLVPVEPEAYILDDIYHFSDDIYRIPYRIPYYQLSGGIHVLEDGTIYYDWKRPVLEKKVADEMAAPHSLMIQPDVTYYLSDDGRHVYPTAIYVGDPDSGNAILLWDDTMNIPLVSPEIEAEYKQIIDMHNHLYELVGEQENSDG